LERPELCRARHASRARSSSVRGQRRSVEASRGKASCLLLRLLRTFLDAHKFPSWWRQILVEIEVTQTNDAIQILRGNTLTTKVFTLFAKRHSQFVPFSPRLQRIRLTNLSLLIQELHPGSPSTVHHRYHRRSSRFAIRSEPNVESSRSRPSSDSVGRDLCPDAARSALSRELSGTSVRSPLPIGQVSTAC
jgi:hypothetical protein